MKQTRQFHVLIFLLLSLVSVSCSKNDSTPATPSIDSSKLYQPREANDTSKAFISKIFEYLPAPGQYTNVAPYGADSSARKLIGNSTNVSNMISLGAYGGYVIFGFDHSIVNSTGADLALYGNPSATFSEPGIVMVSYDANNNGIADDAWYELAGSHYDSASTIKNYAVTYYNPHKYADVPWKDNQGNSGAVKINTFNKHEYYPLFAKNQDSTTYSGTLLAPTKVVSGATYNYALSWGYADNYSTGTDPYGYDNYAKNSYSSFDFDWARDSTGKSTTLKYVDFVKVYTGQLNDLGLLGEVSTEVKGAADLHILNK